MENKKKDYVPSLSQYMDQFNRPNYFDDPRTPEEMKQEWIDAKVNRYYQLYGQEKIISLRPVEKRGEQK